MNIELCYFFDWLGMITTVITTGSIIANRFRTSAAPLLAETPRDASSFKQNFLTKIKTKIQILDNESHFIKKPVIEEKFYIKKLQKQFYIKTSLWETLISCEICNM